MKFINDWKSNAKQSDKIALEIRVSKLTIFNLGIDLSKRKFKLTILNFTVKNQYGQYKTKNCNS